MSFERLKKEAKTLESLIKNICGLSVCLACPITKHHNCDNYQQLVRLEDVETIQKQLQELIDKLFLLDAWIKNNVIKREDFVDDDDFDGYALELANAIRIFLQKKVLGCEKCHCGKEATVKNIHRMSGTVFYSCREHQAFGVAWDKEEVKK